MLHVQSKGASSDARLCSWLLLELTGLVLVLLLLTLALAPAAIAVASVATFKCAVCLTKSAKAPMVLILGTSSLSVYSIGCIF